MANPMMDSEKSKGIDGGESGAIGYGQFPMAQSQGVEAPIGVYGNASGTAARGKRRVVGELLDKATQQKQKRMIKNRESAATSRKRKHAYTMELEAQVKQLEEENEKLLEEVKQRKKERLKQVGGFCIFQNVAMDGRIEEESGQCKKQKQQTMGIEPDADGIYTSGEYHRENWLLDTLSLLNLSNIAQGTQSKVSTGDPRKMAMVDVGNRLPPMKRLEKMSRKLTDLLPCLFALADIIEGGSSLEAEAA